MSLDEQALRRADFSEGYAVQLADGQRWTFPSVKIRIFPEEQPDGRIEAQVRPWYANQMEREIDILFGLIEAPWFEVWQARFTIAANLLKANYDLPPGAVKDLLSYVAGDLASEAMWEKVRAAILGRDPEPTDEGEGDDDPKAGEATSNTSDSP